MNFNFQSGFCLGILGGGQLGKMLVKSASQLDIKTCVLDPSSDCPASEVSTNFEQGDFRDYQTVYNFGKKVDLLTIEIENVNTDALIQLKEEGVLVHPDPVGLNIIKDKGQQKNFYDQHQLPTSPYLLFDNKESIVKAVGEKKLTLPFVQKLRTEGYDGKGVAVIRNEGDLDKLMEGKSLIEDMVKVKKEISVIAARNEKGEVVVYSPVEMVFNPVANLVEYQLSPADISESIAKEATEMAVATINAYGISGLLAVELFLDENDKLLVNEVAPRPHNSGHQTIESAYTSQYEQHLRAITGLPLGSTKLIIPSIMVNLLGQPGHTGTATYEGIQDCMAIEGIKIHLYGKKETRPYRKMGHATILDPDIASAKRKADFVLNTLKITA